MRLQLFRNAKRNTHAINEMHICIEILHTCFPKPCSKSFDCEILRWLHCGSHFPKPLLHCLRKTDALHSATEGRQSRQFRIVSYRLYSSRKHVERAQRKLTDERTPCDNTTSRVLLISKLSGNVSSELLRIYYIFFLTPYRIT